MAQKKKKTKIQKKKPNRTKHWPEVLLVLSALILGCLIILLVYRKHHQIVPVTEEQTQERVISGSYPLPSELIESDKDKYFAYMEIPDMIFNKMNGVSFTEDCPVTRDELRYMQVLYWGTDGVAHTGEMIVNQKIAAQVQNVFYQLYKAAYPIERISLVDEYGGNDEVSMANNNTSCFNARKVAGSDAYSLHAYGMAIDLNPLYNPYVGTDGTVLPVTAEAYADRDKNFTMKIDETDYAYQVFINNGFSWGGSWSGVKDYQHFEYVEE